MSTTIYEDLELAVVAALAGIGAGAVEVVLFSDENVQVKSAFVKPRISVSYHSFTGSDPVDTGTSVFSKTINIQVMFEAKKTRGVLGIYDLEVQAEKILNGLKLPNYKRFTIGQFSRNERTDDGIWVYNLIVKTEGAADQVFDDLSPALALAYPVGYDATLKPVLRKITVAPYLSERVNLFYDRELSTVAQPAIIDFKVSGKTVTAAFLSVSGVALTVSPPFVAGEALSVSYIPGVNKIKGLNGNLADGFTWAIGVNSAAVN